MLNHEQPAIVTICGSTRFRSGMTAANRELTLAGYIVLAPGVFGHDGDEMTTAQKNALDELHLRKIDLAELIYVVNPGGYIGDSTRREIAYAHQVGKGVRYLVEVDQDSLDFRPKPSEKNTQEPCDICSGYGCPDCRDDLAGGEGL